MTDKQRSKKHAAGGAGELGYVATRRGDAIRVDLYVGRSKVHDYAYFLDVTTWPAERIDQTNAAYFALRNPTLLRGPSLRKQPPEDVYARQWLYADAFVRAVNEVVE